MTVALSVTIRPQFAIECLRRSNQQGWVNLGPNLWVFPLEQTRHVGVAKSEHPRLTNGEINFEEFQPMWSQSTNVTDGQRDGQTTCDRNTALCTKVHRAVKTNKKAVLVLRTPRSKRIKDAVYPSDCRKSVIKVLSSGKRTRTEEANGNKWVDSYRWSTVTDHLSPFLRYDELQAEKRFFPPHL